jgi:hypothetical protein
MSTWGEEDDDEEAPHGEFPVENSWIYPFVDQQAHLKGPQKELITVAPDDDQSIIYGLILSPFRGFESLGRLWRDYSS